MGKKSSSSLKSCPIERRGSSFVMAKPGTVVPQRQRRHPPTVLAVRHEHPNFGTTTIAVAGSGAVVGGAALVVGIGIGWLLHASASRRT